MSDPGSGVQVRRVRQPWQGKVYNPRQMHEQAIEEKRQTTSSNFQKSQREAILKRFDLLEDSINKLARAVKDRFESIEADMAKVLKPPASKKVTPAVEED